jgi:acyl carrier protein
MSEAMVLDDTEKRVTAIAVGLLAKRGLPAPVAPTQPLKEAGLSSLDLVSLMLAVEDTFDLFIPETMMTPAHLGSIAAVAALVRGLRPPS